MILNTKIGGGGATDYRNRTFTKIISFIIVVTLLFTTVVSSAFAVDIKVVNENNVTENDVIEKSEDSTTYELSSGAKMTVFYGENVRYEDENGNLVDYDPSLKEISEEESLQGVPLDDYSYENKKGDSKQYIPSNLNEETPLLMEKDKYSVALSLTNSSLADINLLNKKVKCEEEEVEDLYEDKTEEKLVNALYGKTDQDSNLQYTSNNTNVKESIILNKKPNSNVLYYILKLKGITPKKNAIDEGISYYDSENGDLVGGIDPPNMNDASEEAYSEDIKLEIHNANEIDNIHDILSNDSIDEIKKDKKDGIDTYVLKMEISQEYLDAEDREYPVCIDPTNSWTGSKALKDAYVISGTKYKNINFYTNSIIKMPSGKNDLGSYRTYLKIIDLKAKIKDTSVSSAKLTVYDYGDSIGSQKIGIKRVLESWDISKLTWANKPSCATNALSTITTKSKTKTSYSFNVTSFAKGVANGTYSNYGLCLVNESTTPKWTCMYGSRYKTSTKRPKLTVTYYAKPCKPTKVSLSPTSSKTGKNIKLSYSLTGESGLKSVKYKLQKKNSSGAWADYKSGTAKKGLVMPDLSSGTYRVGVYGVNKADVLGSTSYSSAITVDTVSPVISTPSIKTNDMGDKTSLGNNWTNDANPKICFDSISDNMSISKSSIKYAITPYNDDLDDNSQAAAEASAYKAGNLYVNDTAPFKGYLNLTKEDQKIKSGKYLIHLKVTDCVGNTCIKQLKYFKDNEEPTGNILLTNANNVATSNLRNTVSVYAELDGTGSALKPAALVMKSIDGKTYDLTDKITESKLFSLNTKNYENGKYNLVINLEDEMGYTKTISQEVSIENPLDGPELEKGRSFSDEGIVKFDFGKNADKIASVEYKLDEGEWTNLDEKLFEQGQIIIPTPEEGIYNVKVRGLDKANITSMESSTTVIRDSVKPDVEINSIDRNRIYASVFDENIAYWSLLYRAKDSDEDFIPLGIMGTDNVKNENVGLFEPANTMLENGTVYEIKVEATDLAGNSSDYTCELRFSDSNAVLLIPSSFRLKRPSHVWDYSTDCFELPSQTSSLNVCDNDSGIEDEDVDWYIDNQKQESIDLLKYLDGKKHDVIGIAKGDSDNQYSQSIIKNDDVVSLDEVKTVYHSDKNITSFRVKADNIENISVQVGNELIYPTDDDTIYVCDITESAYVNDITILSDEKIINGQLQVDTIQEEYITVSKAANYLPHSFSFDTKLNNRDYVYWDNRLPENTSETEFSYRIYHSDVKNFDLNESSLAADGLKTGFFKEMTYDYGKMYYYALTVVERDKNGKIVSESKPLRTSGRLLDDNELAKRLGSQEFFTYTDFTTPNGAGQIEESEGNLIYTQDDISFSNENMDVVMSRVYNSKSSEKSALGMGWSLSFDMELLGLGLDDNDYSKLVLKDCTGAITTFKKNNESDEYISSQGEYMRLSHDSKVDTVAIENRKASDTSTKQLDKVEIRSEYTLLDADDVEYRFDACGKLVYIGDKNGSYEVFSYNPNTGFLQTVTSNKGIEIKLEYNYDTTQTDGDAILVNRIIMPDGTSREYEYDNINDLPVLERVDEVSADGDTISYKYEYDDASDIPNLETIVDAESNEYSICYDKNDRVSKFEYPNEDGYVLQYEDRGDETETKLSTYTNGDEILNSSLSTFGKNTGYLKQYINENGKKSNYEYEDGILIQTSYDIAASHVNRETGEIVSDGVVKKVEKSEIGKARETKKITTEDGITTEYDYSNPETEEVSEVKTCDQDGNVISQDSYEYDDEGNLLSEYDAVENITTINKYDKNGELVKTVTYSGHGETGKIIESTEYEYFYLENGHKKEVITSVENDISTATTTVYDELGTEIEEEISVNGQLEKKEESVFDGFNRVIKQIVTEPSGITTTNYEYDDNGKVIYQEETTTNNKETLNSSETTTYDNRGREVLVISNDNGEESTEKHYYDYEDIVVFSPYKEEGVEYKNSMMERITEDGYVTGETYLDNAGNAIRTKNNGVYTDYIYDEYGTNIGLYISGDEPNKEDGILVLSCVNKAGYTGDVITNPIKDSAGNYCVGDESIVSTLLYDDLGRQIKTIDGNGNAISYEYDQKDQLTAVISSDGTKTSYNYSEQYKNGELQLKTVTNYANGSKSELVQRSDGETISVSDISGDDVISSRYEYDKQGRCVKEIAGDGTYKKIKYDKDSKVVSEAYYTSNDEETKESTYVYDINDNVTKTQDYRIENGKKILEVTRVKSYDKQGNLISSSEVYGENEPTSEEIDNNKIEYKYNKKGLLVKSEYNRLNSKVKGQSYEYDKEDRLTKIYADTGLLFDDLVREYEYDRFGRKSKVIDYYNFADGGDEYLQREYTYDDLGQLSDYIVQDEEGQTVESYTYEYDKCGNIVRKESASIYKDGVEDLEEKIKLYEYDKCNRLIKVSNELVGDEEVLTANEDDEILEQNNVDTYSYDEVGNIIKSVKDGLITENTYNGFNQLIKAKSVRDDEVESNITYDYDDRGNRISEHDSIKKTDVNITYTLDNMASAYVKEENGEFSLKQTNIYNGDGQRIRKTDKERIEDEDGTKDITSTVSYYYDGDAVISTDVVKDTETGEDNTSGTINIRDLNDDIIATSRETGTDSEKWYTYNLDEQGSTTSIIDKEGDLVQSYEYDEYGNIVEQGGAEFDNEFCYTGQIYDKLTGLYYYNARFYDPTSGGFTTQDTYRGEVNSPATLNYYAYCAGNPVNNIDPSGHSFFGNLWNSAKSWVKKTYNKVRNLRPVKRIVKAVRKHVSIFVRIVKPVIKKLKPVYKTIKKAVTKTWRKVKKRAKAFVHKVKKFIKKKVKAREKRVMKSHTSKKTFKSNRTVSKGHPKAKLKQASKLAGKLDKANNVIGAGMTLYDTVDGIIEDTNNGVETNRVIANARATFDTGVSSIAVGTIAAFATACIPGIGPFIAPFVGAAVGGLYDKYVAPDVKKAISDHTYGQMSGHVKPVCRKR